MEDKAASYSGDTQGKIAAVLILDFNYPNARWAKVSLRVTGGSALYRKTFYTRALTSSRSSNLLAKSDLGFRLPPWQHPCPRGPLPAFGCRSCRRNGTVRSLSTPSILSRPFTNMLSPLQEPADGCYVRTALKHFLDCSRISHGSR